MSTSGTLRAALDEFEAWLRPVVDDTQALPPGTPRIAYPRTAAGVGALRAGVRLASSGPVRRAAGRVLGSAAESERALPPIQLPAGDGAPTA